MAQLEAARARASAVWAVGWLPKAIRESNVRHWASKPSYLKTHDWRLLCGLLGKYMLAGFLAPAVRTAVFNMLELMDRLLAKEFKTAELAQLEAEVRAGLCSLEQSVPDCEAGILRHLILHIAERIATSGPPWASAMWPWERLWGRVVKWMKQKVHPETTIMHGYVAFRAAFMRYDAVAMWLLLDDSASMMYEPQMSTDADMGRQKLDAYIYACTTLVHWILAASRLLCFRCADCYVAVSVQERRGDCRLEKAGAYGVGCAAGASNSRDACG